MLIAQISDFHMAIPGRLVYGVIDTYNCLRRCIAHLNALDPLPDVIIATGDLVDQGEEPEYEHLRKLLDTLVSPIFVIPGNHDNREALRNAFRDQPYIDSRMGRIRYVVDSYPVRLVALDTVTPHKSHGTLDQETLLWLDGVLSKEPSQPTVLFMHHPPFRTGIRYMDEIGLSEIDAMALGGVVKRHPQIQKILCGHLHRAIETCWYGRAVSTSPSCAHQIELRLGNEPLGNLILEPPGFHLHYWTGTQMVTHTACIGSYDTYRLNGRTS